MRREQETEAPTSVVVLQYNNRTQIEQWPYHYGYISDVYP